MRLLENKFGLLVNPRCEREPFALFFLLEVLVLHFAIKEVLLTFVEALEELVKFRLVDVRSEAEAGIVLLL